MRRDRETYADRQRKGGERGEGGREGGDRQTAIDRD